MGHIFRIHCLRLIFRQDGGGEDRVENERFLEGIVSRMYYACGQVGDFTGAEDAVLPVHPLFGTAFKHMDDLLPVGMAVKGMAVPRRHRGTDHEQLFGSHQIRAAEPLVVGPRIGLADGFSVLDKTSGCVAHILCCGWWISRAAYLIYTLGCRDGVRQA